MPKMAHYLAKAGHLAVMSQLALRGYNIAMPEIDIGDDIFALNDLTGRLYRIQVKTSTARTVKEGKANEASVVQVSIPTDQLTDAQNSLYYVFTTHVRSRWKFLVIERGQLHALHAGNHIGAVAGPYVVVRFVFFKAAFNGMRAATTTNRNAYNLTLFYRNWDAFPVVGHQ